MPSITDPQYGCVYQWKTRGDSLLTMQNKLILPGRSGERIKVIPLTISIHRTHLRLFLEPVRSANDILIKIKNLGRFFRSSSVTSARTSDTVAAGDLLTLITTIAQ